MKELSDAAILERFGPLCAEFHEALCSDLHLLADIVEKIVTARQLRQHRSVQGRAQAVTGP